jgi:hypothetical protein
LLRNDEEFGAVSREIGRHGQQQRARAGDDDALSTKRRSILRQRLRAADTDDVGQRPTRKWEKSLARTCRDDKRLSADFSTDATALGDDNEMPVRALHVDDRRRPKNLDAARVETRDPPARCARRRRSHAGPPDLATQPWAFVDHDGARPGLRGRRRSRDARGSAADHDDVASVVHRPPASVSTRIPGSTTIMHAR